MLSSVLSIVLARRKRGEEENINDLVSDAELEDCKVNLHTLLSDPEWVARATQKACRVDSSSVVV